jgi:LmbE family N-acetylglucosaminyl deacetylase
MAASDSRVLVLSPHPDDESLGCGGTLKLLTSSGTPCDICFLTRGERGCENATHMSPGQAAAVAECRSAEARQAAEILGAREVIFLGGADGCLSEQPGLADPLADLLQQGAYTRVFCPWQGELHPDHLATFRIMKAALASAPKVSSVWLYEVWTPLMPTNYVPIDATLDAKRLAIQAHRSQLELLDYLGAFLGLAAYRGLQCPPTQYAEAFIVRTRDAILRS